MTEEEKRVFPKKMKKIGGTTSGPKDPDKNEDKEIIREEIKRWLD